MVSIRIDAVVYDTVECTAFLKYDVDSRKIKDAYLMSNLSYTKNSSIVWEDLVQYGACMHYCKKDELAILADCIKDKKWTSNDKDIPHRENVLKAMYKG